jgi:hypothetical protein
MFIIFRKPFYRLLLSLFFAALIVGCAGGLQRNVQLSLVQCQNPERAGIVSQSMGALLLALDEEGWILLGVNMRMKVVRARRCHATEVTDCALMSFMVRDSGMILAHNAEGATISGELVDDVLRWKTELDSAYSKYRCKPIVDLKVELVSRGIVTSESNWDK